MANITADFVKSVSILDYLPAFRASADEQTWDWNYLTTVRETDRNQEQVFSIVGLPASSVTGELEPVKYESMAELSPTIYNLEKYTIGTMFSYELLKDNNHIRDFMAEAGEAMGEAHAFVVDASVAQTYNRAFNPAFPVYDGKPLCAAAADPHVQYSGDTLVNSLAPMSLSFDSIWEAIIHFETTLISESGLFIHDKADWIMYHPSQQQEIERIFEAPGEPETDFNNANTLRKYSLTLIPNRYLTSTAAWFIGGSKYKADNLFFWNDRPSEPDWEDDFDRMGVKGRSFMRFMHGPRDYRYIVGNPGV